MSNPIMGNFTIKSLHTSVMFNAAQQMSKQKESPESQDLSQAEQTLTDQSQCHIKT